ncbi:TetR/AcrR family transcriptional regulator [Parvibaculaceae bacterium PLY_AMNH_Bact1]|nr:TetR/AcrR family transcriptional regulator [Parvibaculaceae bacterium PLY_AMNH_Bact1]
MSNRERILEETRALMNEHGAGAIGTTQIAEALKISPGNLYYHFKNKEEIIRILFDDVEKGLRDLVTADIEIPISPTRFAGFYLRSLDVVWEYRFFYGGLLQILRNDEELAERYRKIQAEIVDALEGLARQFYKDGNMAKPKGRNGFRSVGLNTWLVWTNWIRYKQTMSPTQLVTREDLVEGVGQIFDVLTPYLKPDFERAARRVLMRELNAGSPHR